LFSKSVEAIAVSPGKGIHENYSIATNGANIHSGGSTLLATGQKLLSKRRRPFIGADDRSAVAELAMAKFPDLMARLGYA
jgi:hypothetical protein